MRDECCQSRSELTALDSKRLSWRRISARRHQPHYVRLWLLVLGKPYYFVFEFLYESEMI